MNFKHKLCSGRESNEDERGRVRRDALAHRRRGRGIRGHNSSVQLRRLGALRLQEPAHPQRTAAY